MFSLALSGSVNAADTVDTADAASPVTRTNTLTFTTEQREFLKEPCVGEQRKEVRQAIRFLANHDEEIHAFYERFRADTLRLVEDKDSWEAAFPEINVVDLIRKRRRHTTTYCAPEAQDPPVVKYDFNAVTLGWPSEADPSGAFVLSPLAFDGQDFCGVVKTVMHEWTHLHTGLHHTTATPYDGDVITMLSKFAKTACVNEGLGVWQER